MQHMFCFSVKGMLLSHAACVIQVVCLLCLVSGFPSRLQLRFVAYSLMWMTIPINEMKRKILLNKRRTRRSLGAQRKNEETERDAETETRRGNETKTEAERGTDNEDEELPGGVIWWEMTSRPRATCQDERLGYSCRWLVAHEEAAPLTRDACLLELIISWKVTSGA